MLTFAFRKLVRDKILDQQLAEGSKPTHRILSKEEHLEELVKKLGEESRELATADSEEAASEIADLQQVIDDLTKLLGVDPADVRREQERKNQKFGAFEKSIFIEQIEIDDQNPWVAHYRKHPDRYIEMS